MVMITLFKLNKLLSLRKTSVIEFWVYETKDEVDRLNTFSIVLRFLLKSNLNQGLRSYRVYQIELLSYGIMQ